jgi:hypothetical protein
MALLRSNTAWEEEMRGRMRRRAGAASEGRTGAFTVVKR